VIGVLEAKGESATGQDQDDFILMPYTTVMKKLKGISWLDDIWASAISADLQTEAEREVTGLLRERHRIVPGTDDDFNIRHPVDLANAAADSEREMELLLVSIASIALVVGGIGIMNIMLVSVTERTREIGIRKAVGARRSDILTQFLVEAVVLSVLGGIAGVLAGLLGSQFKIASVQPAIAVYSIPLAFGAAVLTGLFFGTYPAARAAAMRPIDALRFE
ncbi:MAG: ABC transporter permease, partial [Solirubrobacteraceae bacterium]